MPHFKIAAYDKIYKILMDLIKPKKKNNKNSYSSNFFDTHVSENLLKYDEFCKLHLYAAKLYFTYIVYRRRATNNFLFVDFFFLK